MGMITARDVLPQLKKVRRSGRGWTALCPAHDDKKPSLSIADGDRGLMLHCFTGCSVENVKRALGVDTRQTWPAPRRIVRPAVRPAIEDKPPDLETLWSRWSRETDPYHVDGFAMSLGVSTDSLQAIGCAWNGRAWAFPMKDATGKMIGIRLRSESGDKWAVRGSHQGLFFSNSEQARTLFVVEGPTDCAAGVTLGLNTLGRPACIGQEAMILSYVQRVRASRVVIVSDNDEPGLRGAAKLQAMLPVMNCLWVPPAKDIRQFVSLGGDRDTLEASIKDLVWTRPRAIAA